MRILGVQLAEQPVHGAAPVARAVPLGGAPAVGAALEPGVGHQVAPCAANRGNHVARSVQIAPRLDHGHVVHPERAGGAEPQLEPAPLGAIARGAEDELVGAPLGRRGKRPVQSAVAPGARIRDSDGHSLRGDVFPSCPEREAIAHPATNRDVHLAKHGMAGGVAGREPRTLQLRAPAAIAAFVDRQLLRDQPAVAGGPPPVRRAAAVGIAVEAAVAHEVRFGRGRDRRGRTDDRQGKQAGAGAGFFDGPLCPGNKPRLAR